MNVVAVTALDKETWEWYGVCVFWCGSVITCSVLVSRNSDLWEGFWCCGLIFFREGGGYVLRN